MPKKTNRYKQFTDYLLRDIWRVRADSLPRLKSMGINQLRVLVLSIRGFIEDKCYLRASALTYYCVLSIVPVAALAFGIAKGFGFAGLLETKLYEVFQGQDDVAKWIVEFSNSLLEKTKGGIIAGLGVVVLFWTTIKLLAEIESAFNAIWGVNKDRTFIRKFSDYISIIVVCPVLFIVAGALNVFLSGYWEQMEQTASFAASFSLLINAILALIPIFLIWGSLVFIYVFMPNTHVKFSAAVVPGIIAGTLFLIVQRIYIETQVFVNSYGAIYGSFAALPLFLIWLQASWTVVLLGAELSFAYQNVTTYEFEPDCLRVSPSYKRLLTIRIVHYVVKKFAAGEQPPSDSEIASALEMPVRLVRQILGDLVTAKVLNEAKIPEDELLRYQPSTDISKITVAHVLASLDSVGFDSIPVVEDEGTAKLRESLKKIANSVVESSGNVLLKDI
ncbi:MAG: YihY/virulence factor BrkB family protein [Planctomycetota bacterium]